MVRDTLNKTFVAASGVFITVIIAATACGSAGGTRPEPSELPDGWRREQVREGFVGREFDNPLAGFTIDLPPGWRTGESWPAILDGPSGWIAGVAQSDDEIIPTLRFYVGSAPGMDPSVMEDDPRYVLRDVQVDGQPAFLHLAASDAIDLGPQVGIYYPHIPDGLPGAQTPSLRIEGDSRGFTDQELLGKVLTSVRYAEIARLPEIPSPIVTPLDDWRRVPARSDWPSFTLSLPPGWQTESGKGIDSLVGTVSGDGVRLFYDFGGFAGMPIDPISQVRERRDGSEHLIWEERIGDRLFWFVQPVSPDPAPDAITGAFIFLDRFEAGNGVPTVSFSVAGLDLDQQQLVLALLRTVEPEVGPLTSN